MLSLLVGSSPVTPKQVTHSWIFLGGPAKAKQTKPWYDCKPSDLGMHMHGCLEHPFTGYFDATCCQNMLRLARFSQCTAPAT